MLIPNSKILIFSSGNIYRKRVCEIYPIFNILIAG